MNNYKKFFPILLSFIILLSIPITAHATPYPLLITTDVTYKQIIDEIGQGILFNGQFKAYLNRILIKQIKESERIQETENKTKLTPSEDWYTNYSVIAHAMGSVGV